MNFAKFSYIYPNLGRLYEFSSNVDLPCVNVGDSGLLGILEVQASRLTDEEMVVMHDLNNPRQGDIINKRQVHLLDDWLTSWHTGE